MIEINIFTRILSYTFALGGVLVIRETVFIDYGLWSLSILLTSLSLSFHWLSNKKIDPTSLGFFFMVLGMVTFITYLRIPFFIIVLESVLWQTTGLLLMYIPYRIHKKESNYKRKPTYVSGYRSKLD